MNWLEWDKVFVAFLTAAVVALVNWVQNHRLAAKTRHADRIQQQLNKLYGPAYVGWREMRDLLHRSMSLLGATYSAYASAADDTHEEEKDKSFQVVLANAKTLRVRNKKLVRLVATHFALCEPEDAPLFLRCITEMPKIFDEASLPLEVKLQLGEAEAFGDEMEELLNKRFTQLAQDWRNVARPPHFFSPAVQSIKRLFSSTK